MAQTLMRTLPKIDQTHPNDPLRTLPGRPGEGEDAGRGITLRDASCFPVPLICKHANQSGVARWLIRHHMIKTTRETDGFRLFR